MCCRYLTDVVFVSHGPTAPVCRRYLTDVVFVSHGPTAPLCRRYLTDVVFGNRYGMFTIRPQPLTLQGEPTGVALVGFRGEGLGLEGGCSTAYQ